MTRALGGGGGGGIDMMEEGLDSSYDFDLIRKISELSHYTLKLTFHETFSNLCIGPGPRFGQKMM